MTACLLSVVVCSRNRADLLAGLLESLVRQSGGHADWEVVVVDNASTDDTPRIVRDFQILLPNSKYLREETPGLANARNRGWRECGGEYVGYVDDDCRLPEEWVSVAEDIASRVRPSSFGGPYYPLYPFTPSAWFRDKYFSHSEGDRPRNLKDGEFLSGGNMFVRRELLELTGGFPTDLGMAGKKISYGEETFFFRKLRRLRPEATVFYDPRLYLQHIVRPEKTSLLWLARSRFAAGRDYARIFDEKQPSGRFLLLRRLFWNVRQLFKELSAGVVLRDRREYPFFQNYLVEVCFRRIVDLGADLERLRPHRP